MDLLRLLHRELRRTRNEGESQMNALSDLFEAEVTFNFEQCMSRDDWVPTYPGFGSADSGNAGAEMMHALFSMAPSSSMAYSDHRPEKSSNLQSSLSPSRPNLSSSKVPPPTWGTGVRGSPTATVVPVHGPKLPPLHPDATVAVLPGSRGPETPNRANLKREMREDEGEGASGPPSKYETPKPRGNGLAVFPGSAFLPKFTPAAIAQEAFLEALVPLPTSPAFEDQYEVTEWEESGGETTALEEEEIEKRRAEKKIPAWCVGWIETARTQTSIDPETVFGTQLPKCDLNLIFGDLAKESAYLRARKGKRGSSGEWGLDRISKAELDDYRNVMGHTHQLESVVILHKPLG